MVCKASGFTAVPWRPLFPGQLNDSVTQSLIGQSLTAFVSFFDIYYNFINYGTTSKSQQHWLPAKTVMIICLLVNL